MTAHTPQLDSEEQLAEQIKFIAYHLWLNGNNLGKYPDSYESVEAEKQSELEYGCKFISDIVKKNQNAPSDELRKAAYKAVDAYLDAGGGDFVIISRTDHDRNWQSALEQDRAAFADRVLAVVPEKTDEYADNLSDTTKSFIMGQNQAIDQVTTAITNLVAEGRGEKKDV